MSKLGASVSTLLEQYNLLIRSLLVDQTAPIYSGSLSQGNIKDFEEVQKSAFKIILKGGYKDYANALKVLNQKTLEERRENISIKFAKKEQ